MWIWIAIIGGLGVWAWTSARESVAIESRLDRIIDLLDEIKTELSN